VAERLRQGLTSLRAVVGLIGGIEQLRCFAPGRLWVPPRGEVRVSCSIRCICARKQAESFGSIVVRRSPQGIHLDAGPTRLSDSGRLGNRSTLAATVLRDVIAPQPALTRRELALPLVDSPSGRVLQTALVSLRDRLLYDQGILWQPPVLLPVLPVSNQR
jgi:hypothetical protein